MNIYTGPVAPTYAASVRFEVKSSTSQLSKNLGFFMSAWQNAKDIVSLSFDLNAAVSRSGGPGNFLFVWSSAPVNLVVVFPGPTPSDPVQTMTVPVSSAFFIDSPFLSWEVIGVGPAKTEVVFATADPT